MARYVVVLLVALVIAGAGAAALWPLRVVSYLTSRQGYSVRVGISYGALASQKLNVYTPDAAGDDAPVVVFFHGGGWSIGNKDEYGFIGQALASAGVIVVVPDYRLNPEVVFPAFVEDGARAVAWAAAELGGHPLFVVGHSAGAHIAALIATDEHYLADAGALPHAVAGFIGLSGPYDFLPLTEERYKRVFPEATRDSSQPIRFVDGGEPPMLLVTGDADRTVNPGNTTRFAAALAGKGVEASVKVYPGVGHLGTMLALAGVLPYPKPPVRDDILAFMAAIGANLPAR